MTTRKQSIANRRSAEKSTGPRTDEGKARSAGSAVTHGSPVLPDEDAAEYAEFAAGVRADLAPQGALEEALAVRVAAGMWRLLRVGRIEAACFAHELARASDCAARLRDIPGLPPRAADGEEHALGAAFLKLDADGLPNSLARYESAIQRGVERSMKLLADIRKLRAATERSVLRNGPNIPAVLAGQGFPADSRSARQAGGKVSGHGAEQADHTRAPIAPEVEKIDPEAAPAPAPSSPLTTDWADERSNVIGLGYAPARPGERIEHRVHGNTRYIVRIPIEDDGASR